MAQEREHTATGSSLAFGDDDDLPPPPRIEIRVEKWDPGNRGARAGVTAGTTVAVSPIVGGVAHLLLSGNFVVVSRLFREGDVEPSSVLGYYGSISDSSETASMNKGASVGSTIVDDAFARHIEQRFEQCLLQQCG